MNHRIPILFLLFFAGAAYAQTKKQIKLNKIKSCTETTTETVNGKEVSYKSQFSVFDKAGNTTEETDFLPDGGVRKKTTTKFDGKGNKIDETEMIMKEDKPKPDEPKPDIKNTHTVSKYDSNNNKTEEVVYDGAGKQIKKIQTSYNMNGDKTIEVRFDKDNKLIKKEIYNYDSKGLKIEHKTYDGNNVVTESKKFAYQF